MLATRFNGFALPAAQSLARLDPGLALHLHPGNEAAHLPTKYRARSRHRGAKPSLPTASEYPEIFEQAFADSDALGRIVRRRHVDVQGERRDPSAVVHPARPPAELRRAREAPPCLAIQRASVPLLEANDVTRDLLRSIRRRKLVLRQPRNEASLFDRADLERTVEPERIDGFARLPVSVTEAVEPDAVSLQPDPAGDLLIDRRIGHGDRLP